MPEKVEVPQDKLNTSVERALQNDEDLVERVADHLLNEMEKSDRKSGLKEDFRAKMREATGDEVAADRAVDAAEQALYALEKRSRSENKELMKKQLRGNFSDPRSAKEIRDQFTGFEDGKAEYGDTQRNVKRAQQGYRYKAPFAQRALSCMTRAVYQGFSEVNSRSFWKEGVRSRAKQQGYEDIAKIIDDHYEKDDVHQAGTQGTGGAFVPEPLADSVIPFLYANAVVRQFPVRTVQLEHGSREQVKIDSTTSAQRGSEGETFNTTRIGTGKRSLILKKLFIYTIVSNDLIRFSDQGDGIMQIVEDDMVTVASLKDDLDFLRGDGEEETPLGIRNQVVSNNVVARQQDGTESTKEEIRFSLGSVLTKVEGSNANLDTGGWVMHPDEKNAIMLQSGDDDLYAGMVSSMMEGNLLGHEFRTTTQIPRDLDTSGDGTGDESEIYFAAWDSVVIGQSDQLEVSSTEVGSIQHSGSLRSTFARDERAMRLVHFSDILLRHDDAAGVLTEVDFAGDSFG